MSERRACKVLKISRSLYRYAPKENPKKEKVRTRVIGLAKKYGRYGYRTITDIMRNEGWDIGRDAVYRIWREEGLQVPCKQPKKGRLWLKDGSCIRLRPQFKNHVWSYDFVHDRTHDGKPFRILNIIDEYSRECLASLVRRRFSSTEVLLLLVKLFLRHGKPVHIRSDNGPEFVAKKLRAWLEKLKVAPLFIYPGSPWENGYVESFNGRMRFDLLSGEIFYSLKEAEVIIEKWREHYNSIRPHSSLGGRPPAPETAYSTTEA